MPSMASTGNIMVRNGIFRRQRSWSRVGFDGVAGIGQRRRARSLLVCLRARVVEPLSFPLFTWPRSGAGFSRRMLAPVVTIHVTGMFRTRSDYQQCPRTQPLVFLSFFKTSGTGREPCPESEKFPFLGCVHYTPFVHYGGLAARKVPIRPPFGRG